MGGINDLDHSLIRLIGDPERRIHNDPVRMLRVLRHAARNNFQIEEQTWQVICDQHHKLLLCPPSRLRDELVKDMQGGCFGAWLELALKSGLLFNLLPLYERALCEKSCGQVSCCEQLRQMVKVVDRLTTTLCQAKAQPLANDFLLALLLLPWANVRFDLVNQRLKGAAAFRFSKELRAALDEEIGAQLNLRRSFRQELVTLLANLPAFINHHQNNSWPKWLRKKSYFKKCSLFFACWQEALGGEEVADKTLAIEGAKSTAKDEEPAPSQGRSRKGRSRGRIRPAFSSKSKDGIFGLKNRPSKKKRRS